MKKVALVFCMLSLLTQARLVEAQSISQLGPNYYVAGVPSIDFYEVAEIGSQRCPEWCWAACSQMILNYHGLYVTQEQVVTKIFGSLQCLSASTNDILNALSGWAPDMRGSYSTIHSEEGTYGPDDLVKILSYRWPLLVCLKNPDGTGHAEVLTAVYYATDAGNNALIDKVVLRDPWPYNPSRQEMSWAEFTSRIQDIIRVWVVRN